MSPSTRPPEPWDSFFKELDGAVDTTVRLDCIGGFVVTLLYGSGRPTADVDVIELAPRAAAETMMELGIRGGRSIRSTTSTLTVWQSPPSRRVTRIALLRCSPTPTATSI
jgi:hypothetical protein